MDEASKGSAQSLAGRETLPAYLNHPAHIPVGEALKADLADLLVMDLEV